MNEWVSVEDKLPPESEIYRVRLQNGDEIRAYFHPDKMQWIAHYGKKTSHWWSYIDEKRLDNVTHWLPFRTEVK